jgi:AraC-like DNA-binding protein
MRLNIDRYLAWSEFLKRKIDRKNSRKLVYLKMHLQLYTIFPELTQYVKVICTMECDSGADTNHIRVLPDTCVEIFLNYTSTPVAIIGQELHQQSIVSSRSNKPMDVQMRKGAGCLAVCFFPGMAYPFFRIPMHELSNSTIPLAELWNGDAGELEDALGFAVSNEQRSLLVQQFLLEILNRSTKVVPIAGLLRRHMICGSMQVSSMRDITGYSQRHLARIFQQQVGLAPLEFLRVSRFIRSLDHLKDCPHYTLTEVAYKSGYYDQAHFIRDCKNYSGLTPGELLQTENVL